MVVADALVPVWHQGMPNYHVVWHFTSRAAGILWCRKPLNKITEVRSITWMLLIPWCLYGTRASASTILFGISPVGLQASCDVESHLTNSEVRSITSSSLSALHTKTPEGGFNLDHKDHKIFNIPDLVLIHSYRCEIWQANQQLYCQDNCQIAEQLDDSKHQSRSAVEILWDFKLRCLMDYWSRPIYQMLLGVKGSFEFKVCS